MKAEQHVVKFTKPGKAAYVVNFDLGTEGLTIPVDCIPVKMPAGKRDFFDRV